LLSIDKNLKSLPQHFWKYISNFRKHRSCSIQLEVHGAHLVQPNAVADAFAKLFRSLYNSHCSKDFPRLPQSSEFVFLAPISDGDLQLFGVCPSNKHCPSARCANAANAVGKDLDIFAIGAVNLNRIYLIDLKLLIIFVHNSNVLCYVVLSYHVLVTSPHLCMFLYFSALMCFFSSTCV
jgi:hypothetical protein